MSAASGLLATAEELERLSGRGQRYELIAGELKRISPGGGRQGNATINLSSYATVHVRQHRLGACFGGDTGFLLARNPDTVLAPDWAFITAARVPAPLPRGYIPVVPDLALESRSHNDSRREIEEKIALWRQYGVKVVWDLDPEKRTLVVYREGAEPQTLAAGNVLTEDTLLPGFSIGIDELF